MKAPLPLSSCAQRCRRTSLLRQRCLTRVPSTYTAPSAIASATGSATWPEESTLNVSCLACTRLHTCQVRGTLDRPARCRRAPSRAAVRSAGRGLERASAGPSSPRVEPRLVVTRRGPDVPRAAPWRQSGFVGERRAEHWQPAGGLGTGCFVLDDIPVLGEDAVLHADQVHDDPVRLAPETGEPTANHHQISIDHDQLRLVPQRRWQATDKCEQPVAPRRDVRAVLEVFRGPERFGGRIIALID